MEFSGKAHRKPGDPRGGHYKDRRDPGKRRTDPSGKKRPGSHVRRPRSGGGGRDPDRPGGHPDRGREFHKRPDLGDLYVPGVGNGRVSGGRGHDRRRTALGRLRQRGPGPLCALKPESRSRKPEPGERGGHDRGPVRKSAPGGGVPGPGSEADGLWDPGLRRNGHREHHPGQRPGLGPYGSPSQAGHRTGGRSLGSGAFKKAEGRGGGLRAVFPAVSQV